MRQLDEILDDLKTRKDNLNRLKKELAGDAAKMDILSSITDLIAKIDPLVIETKRLDGLRKSIAKFATDVDALNGKRKQYINTFNGIKKQCDAVKEDTKTKDFDGIGKDATSYAALNDFEKS